MKENKTEKQPETAKKNELGRKESQPLTPEEIRKRRKMLVYPLLFLVFGVAMWLIFAPSDEGESLPDGFNVEVPMPEEKNLPSDKRAAYEQQDFERKQREKMSTLQDLAVAEDDTDREAVEDVFQTEETASSGGSSGRLAASTSSRSRRTTRKRWNWNGAYKSWNAGRRRKARRRKPPTSSSA